MSTGESPNVTERERRILRDLYHTRNLSMEQVQAIRNRRNK